MSADTRPASYQPQYHDGPQMPFIVLEGVSGIGKSTLTRLLTEQLDGFGIHTLARPHSHWSSDVNDRLRPLPQFAFYLSGVLHASDSIRQNRTVWPVVADRYVSSVIACHAAVHQIGVDVVSGLLEPFRPYLVVPTHTFYLRCTEQTLRDRLESKGDLTRDDQELLGVPGRLGRLLANFAAVAEKDPSAVWVDTDGKTAQNITGWITTHMEEAGA